MAPRLLPSFARNFHHLPEKSIGVHRSCPGGARQSTAGLQCECQLDEEAASASLIAKVMEIWLRTVMLDHKWACIGDNTYVDSTFAGSDHRNYVGALNLRIQPETEDGMVLLVSPEFLRFSRHKVADLVGSEVWKSLDSSKQLMLEGYNFSKACTIIPSLSEAQVLGVCKLLPDEESFEKLELLWSLKHGLSLSSDYFIAARSIYSSHANKWFPSACFLQGHGFSPAPRSIRSSKAMGTLVSFIEQLIAWDFFSCGHLNIKEVLPLDLGTRIPVWIKAATHLAGYMERNKENANSQNCFGEIDLFSREPMPSLDKTFALQSQEFVLFMAIEGCGRIMFNAVVVFSVQSILSMELMLVQIREHIRLCNLHLRKENW